MADLSEVLLAASRADKSAEQRLNEYENANYAEFAHALAKELATDGKNAAARQLASLYLKNMLNAKDPAIQVNKHERWKQLDANARHAVKEEILKAFRSADQGIPRMAAVTSSEIAAVELPYNEWPQFLPTILEYANGAQTPESVKVASIECLGFTAERIFNLSDVGEEKEIPDEAMNNMLTAIVNGVQSGGTPAIKFASITALRNALYFCSKNMEKKQERDAIMSTICDAASIPNDAIRSVAFDCLAQIAYLYYNNLQDYMTKIFELTAAAIRQFDDVSKNAIEFWSTICDTEQERLDEAAEYAELGDPVPADRNCFRYAEAALEALVPILLEALTKQEEDDEEDMFNVHMAATICLTLMSQTVEDKIVNYVMSFVTQNINNGDWRLRDAAIMAFTCILDGPTSGTIGPFVSQAMPALLQAVSDGHPMVRDTTAHCISQICKLHVRAIPPEMFPTLLQELMSKCGDQSPKVAAQACAAIHNLANAFQDQSHEQHQTNALSQFMSDLLSTLWKVCDRNDSNESNLRVASMEAISILVQVSALDQKPLLVQLLPAVVERLNHALNQSSLTNEEQESKEQLQGLLCALIQVLYQKLEKHEVAPHTDRAMTMLLGVLQAQNATCHEEAFAAIAAVADLLEDDFCNYLDAFKPFLIQGLRSFQSFRLCLGAVAAVCDICRAVEGRIQPYCDEIMAALIDALKDVSINRSVKPPVISCFGDVALAIGGAYEPYLQLSAMMLMQASGTQAPPDDEDLIEYVNVLRLSILEAYTGIVQGLKGGNKLHLVMPYVTSIVTFLQQLSVDPNRDDEVLKAGVALIGDIAQVMGDSAEVKNQINQPFIAQMLGDASGSPSDSTREIANWASSAIQRAIQAN